MKAKEIKTLEDAHRYIEGSLNDFETGVSTKEETIESFFDYTKRIMQITLEADSKIEKEIKEEKNQKKSIIDAVSDKTIGYFIESDTQKMLKKYKESGKYQLVLIDINGDIILWKELV